MLRVEGIFDPESMTIWLSVYCCQEDMGKASRVEANIRSKGFTLNDNSYVRKFETRELYKKWWHHCNELCTQSGGDMSPTDPPEPNQPQPVIDMESIANKIKKLLALSQSPNEAEAIAASQKAQELLTQYNLSMADIADPQAIDEEVEQQTLFHLDSKREWVITLLDGVARANFCSIIMTTGRGYGTDYKLIGRPSNIAVASLMYDYLSETVERLTRTAHNTSGERGFKNSFRLGCANRIYFRLMETIKEQCEQGIVSDNGVNCSAIAVTSLYEQRKAEVQIYEQNTYGKIPAHKYRNSVSSHEGYAAGDRAGQSVSLNKQVGAGGVQKYLGGT